MSYSYKIKGKLRKEIKEMLSAESNTQTIHYDGKNFKSEPDVWVMDNENFKHIARTLEGTLMGPVGQQTYTTKEHLASELTKFFILLEYVFKEGAEVTGEHPKVAETPPGVII